MDSFDAAAAATTDAPVLNVINKRIRNLRKKLKRIIQIEEAVAQGKSINKEQEEVLQSKIGVCVTIDELEKLRAPLSVAVSEEIDLAFQRREQEEEEAQRVSAVADDLAAKAQVTNEEEQEEVKVTEEEAVETVRNDDVEDLLNLIYFGSLFDVKMQNDFTSTMFTRTLERNCCLTYDYVTDDATDMLSEKDLSLISTLFGLVSSRPGDSSLSHKSSIQQCIEHAKHWLANSDQPIDSDSSVTYAGLRERLAKILASEYVTITPEMQAPPVEIGVTGNYASFQVSGNTQLEAKDDIAEDHQGHEADNNHTRYKEEFQNQKEDYAILNAADANEMEADEYQRDAVPKDQQFIHRRSHSNQRSGRGGGGGGYNGRGYSNGRGRHGNGRGGGPYQNGRNQSYDQQPGGNYHQRSSYNNRARVGRDGAGGNSYNNRGSTGSTGYAPVDVESG